MSEHTETGTASCTRCDGEGWVTVAAHAPGCDGYRCEAACPVPIQAHCPECSFDEIVVGDIEVPF